MADLPLLGENTPETVIRPDDAGVPARFVLPLRWADESLFILDKPAGLLSVPGRGPEGQHNLTSLLQAQHPEALAVHRLDMATSGLMVFARSPVLQRLLNRAFELREVDKRYEAVVEGVVAADAGEINAPLAADWPNRPRQEVNTERGKASLTRWRVLARESDTTRLALFPVTGRSHQLRVHLQHMGHPIRGDEFYAPQPPVGPRLLLHACQLGFVHPLSGAVLNFESPAPF